MNMGGMPYMAPVAGQFSSMPPPPLAANSAERITLKNQLQSQIEYYFGLDNLIKDLHLRSNLMDSQGFVKIQQIASFRRIQNMTTDLSLISEAIASSTTLEMDPEGQRVRLREGWKEWVLPGLE